MSDHLSSGDPLAGATPPATPPGYTSPPPPGAGGPVAGLPASAPAFGAGTLVLSGWWRRVGAAMIDNVIIFVIAAILATPLGIGILGADTTDDGDLVALITGFLVWILIVAAVYLIYAPLLMSRTNGKTLGRMAAGIRVVRTDGQPIGFGFAALREVVVKLLLLNGVAASFTFGLSGLLDVLWPLWDDENRALHDFVVKTRTVRD